MPRQGAFLEHPGPAVQAALLDVSMEVVEGLADIDRAMRGVGAATPPSSGGTGRLRNPFVESEADDAAIVQYEF